MAGLFGRDVDDLLAIGLNELALRDDQSRPPRPYQWTASGPFGEWAALR
jgi:hypothetical protein